jgi:hypothetical protein
MHADVDARILRLATQGSSDIHRFPNGTELATFSDSGSASGIGDVLLRPKYVFANANGGGLAGGVEVRLPTGDPDNLLGTGAAAATPMLIASAQYGRYSPHLNLGYTFAGRHHTALGNEFQYTVGTEFEASPRLTVSGDVIGRVLRDSGRLVDTTTTLAFQSAAGVPGATTVQELAFQDGNLNVVTGVVGAKVNLFGTLLLSGNVLFPLKKSGLYDHLTPVIGIDYTF